MDVAGLREIARRSGDRLSKQDDAALRAWIDEAFGTTRIRVDVADVQPPFPELALSLTEGANGVGLVLSFSAWLRDRDSLKRIGWMLRRIYFDAGVAQHHALVIVPEMRGQGIGTRLVARAVEMYDTSGVDRITLLAGLDLGRWHWAHAGFEVGTPAAQMLLVEHVRSVIAKLGLDAIVSDWASPREIALLESPSPVTLREVAAASGEFEVPAVRAAARNGIDISAPIALGKAILLCGPEWPGALALDGVARGVFDAYVRERLGTLD